VNRIQLEFWQWLAGYYLCHEGEVMNAALPSALKLASESRISLNPGIPDMVEGLTDREFTLLEALRNRKTIAVSEASRILGIAKTIPVIRSLMEKGLLIPEEELQDPYRPKFNTFVTLTEPFGGDEVSLQELFTELEKRAKKQLELLMTWVRLSGHGGDDPPREVEKKHLLKQSGGSAAQLDALVTKGVFSLSKRLTSRFPAVPAHQQAGSILLSEVQQAAYDQLVNRMADKEVVLLHGVTSSGKTELYIRLIDETLRQGRQVLFLLPEIALTAQIINRLRKYFGDRVGVYHSRFNIHEKVELWMAVNTMGNPDTGKRFDIILGARSAVFLPFSNLGLVIVDEEHDPSFKQADPAPRYNGRDAALYLARLHGAATVLGSATPSVESYYNALRGKYGLVELSERYGNHPMPEIELVSLREALKKGEMKTHFSVSLLRQTEAALAAGEQVIFFQNRRGFSLRLECETCHWMPSCINCDVTLVYHKKNNQLRCHYCGHVAGVPEVCPDCRGNRIKMKGFGTEKVEEELGLLLPGARIGRMDLDTTRSRHAHQQIITDFEEGRINILVGTQMVTKGLDFDNVSLVAILNADNMLSYPDFRSAEHGFQLMAQVSGRAGRKNRQGKVIIQAYNTQHPVIGDVLRHDFASMFHRQMAEREKFRYPPFTRLIMLRLKHRDPDLLNRAADDLSKQLRRIFGKRLLGPEYPLVSRIMNLHIKQIILKLERSGPVPAMKEKLMDAISAFSKEQAWKGVRVVIDVDPQ
jgi:primosomal protein N' (replication factor Y)